MAHNLDFSAGRAGLAFRGDREDIWHRLGQEFQDGWTIDDSGAGGPVPGAVARKISRGTKENSE